MKCIMYLNEDRITRVMDETAARLVNDQKAKYVSKKTWKEQVRDIGKVKK
jgi:hypothetical protein